MNKIIRFFRTGLFTIGKRVFAVAYMPPYRFPIVNACKFLKCQLDSFQTQIYEGDKKTKAETVFFDVSGDIKWISDWKQHWAWEYWQKPYHTFVKKCGDCQGFAFLVYHKLRQNGFEPQDLRIVCVRLLDGRDHFFCKTLINEEWIKVDPAIYQSLVPADIGVREIWLSFNELGFEK